MSDKVQQSKLPPQATTAKPVAIVTLSPKSKTPPKGDQEYNDALDQYEDNFSKLEEWNSTLPPNLTQDQIERIAASCRAAIETIKNHSPPGNVKKSAGRTRKRMLDNVQKFKGNLLRKCSQISAEERPDSSVERKAVAKVPRFRATEKIRVQPVRGRHDRLLQQQSVATQPPRSTGTGRSEAATSRRAESMAAPNARAFPAASSAKLPLNTPLLRGPSTELTQSRQVPPPCEAAASDRITMPLCQLPSTEQPQRAAGAASPSRPTQHLTTMSGGAIATGGRSTDSAAIDLEVKKFWRDLLILKDSSASVGQFEAFQSCSKRLERLETLGYSRTQRNSMQIELYEELREGKRRAEFVQEFVSLQDVLTVKY